MANMQTIVRVRPEFRDFARNRRFGARGEIISFAPNLSTNSFSTDAAGFRHSVFNGETLSAAQTVQHERYGLVLGSSHVFGVGVAGNENTLPSLLAQRFGFPFANISLPEGNSRNLHSLLLSMSARAPKPPAVAVHLSGGDLTAFTLTSVADPVFGSPNLEQWSAGRKAERNDAPAAAALNALLAFTSLWTRAIALQCRAQGTALVLGNDSTFFEKREPSAAEIECGLGIPSTPEQQRWFENHRTCFPEFAGRRTSVAESLGVPLAGPGAPNDLGFIDEFHYDSEGTQTFAGQLADAIDPLLSASS